MGRKEFRDSEMLAHFEGERGACELELEDVAVVVDLLFSNNFELGFDGCGELPGYFLEFG